ncbi:MAG: hypothetical protein ACP5P1_15300 [Acidimicrobiales bacterium]
MSHHYPVVQLDMGTKEAVGTIEAVEEVTRLLDSSEAETTNTSMRLPVALRDAAALAVRELGVAPSTTALASAALRAVLEAVVTQAVLDAHYEQHPIARPRLAELTIAAAELDNHPLAAYPEMLREAAAEITRTHPDADADDVLLWAEARASALA